MELIKYILILGAGQAFLLAVILFKRKINARANKFIGTLYLLFAFNLVHAVYYMTSFVFEFPYFIGFNSSTAYLYGPLMYFYVYTLEDRKRKFKFKGFLHYLPFLIASLIMIFTFWDHSAADKLQIFQNNFEGHSAAWITGALAPLHVNIYIVLAYLETRRINRLFKNSFSSIEFINLAWLNYFTIGAIAGAVLVIVLHIFEAVYDFNAMNYMFIALALAMYTMGYLSLKQPEVNLEPESVNRDENSAEEKKYLKSGMPDPVAAKLAEEIKSIMEKEKPFLNPDLSLQQLAEMVGITTHNLSQILNQLICLSFYDFVNNYRLEEFKKLIAADPEKKQNILTLAYESGFNSKTAFYSIFKKSSGITPSEYRRKQKEDTNA